MNAKLLTAAAALMFAPLSPPAASGTDLAGDWAGVVSQETPFPLVLHVDSEVRLDSPERGLFGVPGDLRQSGDHVTMVFATGGVFDGVVRGDRLQGSYSRGPATLPLAFERKRGWSGRLTAWFAG